MYTCAHSLSIPPSITDTHTSSIYSLYNLKTFNTKNDEKFSKKI